MRHKDKRLNSLSIAIGAWVSFCAILLLFFGGENPSRHDSEAKLALMDRYMKTVLQEGGVVTSSYSNAKYGGALLYVNVDAQSWSQSLRVRYRAALRNLGSGWRSSGNRGDSFCKQGVISTIGIVPGIDASHGSPRKVYELSIAYNGLTKKECS